MSDAEKLSRPSFESLPAGLSLSAEGFAFSASEDYWLEVPAIQFKTYIVSQEQDGGEPIQSEEEDGYQLNVAQLSQQARFGATANSALHHTGKAKYRTTTISKHRVAKEGWSIVSINDLKVHAVPGTDGRPASYSEASQALHELKLQDPVKAAGLKILRLSEVQGNG